LAITLFEQGALLVHLRHGGSPVRDLDDRERPDFRRERRRQREATPEPLLNRLRVLSLQLLLVYAAYVRRLWQRAESLPYLNDRPYSLALYLLFGAEFFHQVCRRVEFDLETTTQPSPDLCRCGSSD